MSYQYPPESQYPAYYPPQQAHYSTQPVYHQQPATAYPPHTNMPNIVTLSDYNRAGPKPQFKPQQPQAPAMTMRNGIAVPIEQPQTAASNRKRTSGGHVGGQPKKQKQVDAYGNEADGQEQKKSKKSTYEDDDEDDDGRPHKKSDKSDERPNASWTIPQLKQYLRDNDEPIPSGAKKADLLEAALDVDPEPSAGEESDLDESDAESEVIESDVVDSEEPDD